MAPALKAATTSGGSDAPCSRASSAMKPLWSRYMCSRSVPSFDEEPPHTMPTSARRSAEIASAA
eukprot:1293703-Prymnesium_polylepis.1